MKLAVMWVHQNEDMIWPQERGECFCKGDHMAVRGRNGEEWDGALLLRSPYTLKTG